MNSGNNLINELAAQYHFIFKGEEDMRLPCYADKDNIQCYGLDEIEICVYYIMQSAGAEGGLRWEIKESGGEYYFYPVADEKFRKELEDFSKNYSRCMEEKNLYYKKRKLVPLYKVCQGKLCDTRDVKSCNIVVDMIFNLNQSGRTKEDLSNFCALFCCYDINYLHAFLLAVQHYIDKNKIDNRKCLKLLKEVTNFMGKVFAFRRYITKESEAQADYMESLKQTSMCLANLIRQRAKSKALPLSQYRQISYDCKIRTKFLNNHWNYKTGIGFQGSCQALFRAIVTRCTGNQLKFSANNDDDIQAVKDFLQEKGIEG